MTSLPITDLVSDLVSGVASGQPVRAVAAARREHEDVEEAAPTPAEIRAATAALNDALEVESSSLRFRLDEGSGKMVIQVYDRQTDEMIRQVPSEELLALARAARLGSALVLDIHA